MPKFRFAMLCHSAIAVLLLFVAAASAQNVTLVGTNKPSTASLEYGDVWGDEDLACVGIYQPYSTGGYGVGIFSITNPAAPVLLGNYYPSPSSNNQFEQGLIRNQIGYFASWSGSGGLHIVSLTNPVSPLLLSRITFNAANTVTNGHNRVHTMFLDRNFVYLADHATTTVKVFDISDPFAPFFVRNIVTTNTVRVHQITVATNGSQVRLYTSGWGDANTGNPPGKTDIWDVTDMSTNQAPQWLGAVITGHRAHSSWPTPDGNHLVICREISGGEVSIWNISNPATPVRASVLTTGGVGIEPAIPHNPVVVGNTLYVSWYNAGLQMFNISDPARPTRIGSFDTYPASTTPGFKGNWGVYPFLGTDKVLLGDMQRGLLIVDVSAAFTATNNYPPLILQQPTNATKALGESVSFSVDATGSATLGYQWRLNGTNISGATTATLTRDPVQVSDAGTYTVIVSNGAGSITSQSASLNVILPPAQEYWQVVFSDNFETNSAENWLIFPGSSNGINDYSAEFGYDYNTYFSAFISTNIPPAPNSIEGTTRGLKLTVNNNDGVAALAAVSLYPKDQFFSGAYRLKFDMWMNYYGAVNGGVGSTELVTLGLNHTGTHVNWDHATSTPSDGVWFCNTSDGAFSSDYRALVGVTNARPSLFNFATSGISASGATSADSSASFFQGLFPAPPYETPGAPSKRWVEVELSQNTNNVLTWRINGTLIAQRTNTSVFTNGNVMIGYMDLNTSIAPVVADQFMLIDNLRVEVPSQATAPTIVSQPQPQAVYPGDSATFTVAVTGSSPISYQWRFNGTNITGATNSIYMKAGVEFSDQGLYSVVVTNEAGTIVSAAAALSLLEPTFIRNVRVTSGSDSAIISWITEQSATSQVRYDIVVEPEKGSLTSQHSEFHTFSYLNPVPVTNHQILLTGLQPDARYDFEAVSSDGTNTYTSSELTFQTAGSIIVDNTNAFFTGTWITGTAATDKYLSDYRFADTVTGTATAAATFTPQITTPGKYDIYVWYSQGNNRASDAPFLISFLGGTQTVLVNQTNNGGDWRLLAANKPFAAGTDGFVRLSNVSASTGKVVIADAIKFVYAEVDGAPGTVPTWWSDYYFGASMDPLLDHDGDGYSTAAEFLLGTIPTDANSRLNFRMQLETNTLHFVFAPFHNDRSYQLSSRTNIDSGTWEPVTDFTVSSGPSEAVLTVTNHSGAQRFYRLLVAP